MNGISQVYIVRYYQRIYPLVIKHDLLGKNTANFLIFPAGNLHVVRTYSSMFDDTGGYMFSLLPDPSRPQAMGLIAEKLCLWLYDHQDKSASICPLDWVSNHDRLRIGWILRTNKLVYKGRSTLLHQLYVFIIVSMAWLKRTHVNPTLFGFASPRNLRSPRMYQNVSRQCDPERGAVYRAIRGAELYH